MFRIAGCCVLLIGSLGAASVLGAQESIDALTRARQEVAARPGEVEPLLIQGRLEAQMGLVPQALETLSAVSAIEPTLSEPYLVGAVLLRNTNQYGSAISLLNKGIEAGVSDPLLLGVLAQLHLAAGDVEEALDAAREGLKLAPQDMGMLMVEGLALALDPASRTEAIDKLEVVAATADNTPTTVFLELGRLLLEDGRAGEAVPHLRRATELDPSSPEGFYRLGTALQQAGDAAGARVALERSQELTEARDQAAHRATEFGADLNEVETLVQAGDLGAARSRLEALLRENPNAAMAHLLMARILFESKLAHSGLASARRALELAPNSVEAHYMVGVFLANMGRVGEARRVLREALILAPDAEPVLQLLAEIDSAESEG